MAKHTPGPWRIDSGQDGSWMIIGCDLVLCQRSPWAIRKAESEANCRLIVAAPDLLAALEGVVRVADRQTVEFDAARAAIARATA